MHTRWTGQATRLQSRPDHGVEGVHIRVEGGACFSQPSCCLPADDFDEQYHFRAEPP